MKKYIVILATLALAIGGSINLTGCGKPAAAPDNRPDPIPAPGYTGPDEPDVLPEGATPVEGSKPAEKE